MKKLLLGVFLTIVLCMLTGTVSAKEEYIGQLYSTNTTAYIDCNQIPVYVFNGYPYVVAEDLNGYGFDVRWSQYENTLYVNYNYYKGYFPYDSVETKLIDEYAGPVYSSDVVVCLNGVQIPSYSLNGRMLISLDEMYRFGKVNWYDESRTIGVTTYRFIDKNPDWETLLPPWYISAKVLNGLSVISTDCSRIMDRASYLAQYDMYKVVDVTHDDYLKLSVYKNYVNEVITYIENSKYLYERGNLYHMAYNSLYIIDAVKEIYGMVDDHSAWRILQNLHPLENIMDSYIQSINELGKYGNELADNITTYIVYVNNPTYTL